MNQYHKLGRVEISQETFWSSGRVTKNHDLIKSFQAINDAQGSEHNFYEGRFVDQRFLALP